MIHRYYLEGQVLDVAGLNEITVLIDRSETELTEVAVNKWPVGMEGPPHLHAEKDQIFYILSGEGKVLLGNKEYMVRPGCLLYVPTGLLHHTVTTSTEPLRYLLYNVFISADKEGHSSFADHIDKVKAIRRQQANSRKHDVAGADRDTSTDKKGKFFDNVFSGKKYDFGSNDTILLLDRTQTNRLEFVVVQWPAGSKGALVAHKEKEQTFFILSGSGRVTIGEETEPVKPGEIIFVPRNTPHTTEADQEELTYLCLNSIITETGDRDFDQMYQRIAPERRKRWESGDTSVGE